MSAGDALTRLVVGLDQAQTISRKELDDFGAQLGPEPSRADYMQQCLLMGKLAAYAEVAQLLSSINNEEIV